MTTRSFRSVVAAAALIFLAWNPYAMAHRSVSTEKGQLAEFVNEANLIVSGVVTKVKYVNAQVEGEGEIPHTFVTYKLRDTLRGKPSGETLTLRFIGGADGRGGFMTVSGVPQFQEGEQDILFVKGSGADGQCPLVDCEWGRYRVHQNRLFNTHGQPVRGMVKNNAIARGRRAKPFETFKFPTPDFDELMKNPEARAQLERRNMSLEQARKEYQSKAPRQLVVKRNNPPPSRMRDQAAPDPQAEGRQGGGKPEQAIGAGPITADRFKNKIKELHQRASRRPSPVKSVDPGAPIVIRHARPANPGKPAEVPEPKQASPQDEEEVRALKNQDFNPVLKKRQ